ncbi:hypothetical protein NW754_010668 [Fusarium falciforme]|nr:hypothetical protein NW754_010668 [Fusarium falciforme]
MSTADAAAPTAPAPSDETLLSDREISECLGEFWAKPFHEKRLSGAARQIFNTTQQWPWQLATGFSPKVWDATTVEELAQTIDLLVKESTESDRHVEIHNLIEFLGEQARERARLCLQSNPELSLFEAKRHFGAKVRDRTTRENNKKQGEVQKISGPTAFASPTHKSARRDGPGNPRGLALGSLAKRVTPAEGIIDSLERVQGEALTPSPMSDMIGTVENLKVESQTYLNESTRKLDKAQSFEQYQGEMASDPLLVSQASEQHDMKLRECDEGIARAEAELHDMDKALTFATQQGDKRQDKLEKVQAKVSRLEARQTHLALEFEYYRTIERLMKLGPHGLASLTERLAESGISLLTATKDPPS